MDDFSAIISTPIGNVGIITNHDKIHYIKLLRELFQPISPKTTCAKQVVKQLNEYFHHNPKYMFDLPIHLKGTDLQKKTWLALSTIPTGHTSTYSELAAQMNTHPRVIGNICRHNPIPIVLPCHRIIAKNSLGGFFGETKGPCLAIKEWLLNYEKYEKPTT